MNVDMTYFNIIYFVKWLIFSNFVEIKVIQFPLEP